MKMVEVTMFNPANSEKSYYPHFVKLGRKFGYTLDEEGSCEGFVHAGLGALVTGEFDAYEKGLAAVTQLNVNELLHTTLPAYQQAQTRNRAGQFDLVQLALPLIKNVVMNQSPENYPDVFDVRAKESIQQQAINHFTKEKVVIVEELKFYKCYSRESLTKAIDALHECVKDISFSFGFGMISQEHIIALGRDKGQWLFLDVNALPVKRCQNTNEIVEKVFSGFEYISEDNADGFFIAFNVVVKESNQVLLVKALLPWRNAQDAQCFDEHKVLSHADIKRAIANSVACNDMRIISVMKDYPRMDINSIQLNFECTLLYLCAEYNHIEMAKVLLADETIDVNLGIEDCTPLYVAADKGHKEMVALLLEHPNINSNIKCIGHTAMNLAKQRRHHDIVTLIRNHENEKYGSVKHKKQKIN